MDENIDLLQTDEEFRLTAPDGEDNDESSIGELTTQNGFGSSIEIKLISEVADAMEHLDNGGIRWENIPENTQESS